MASLSGGMLLGISANHHYCDKASLLPPAVARWPFKWRWLGHACTVDASSSAQRGWRGDVLPTAFGWHCCRALLATGGVLLARALGLSASRRGPGADAGLGRLSRRRAKSNPGGTPAPVLRRRKRERQERKEEKLERFRSKFTMDLERPPPMSRNPKTGAWKDGRPENEESRQGQIKSPWTGQVYDRWAPQGGKQIRTDRQGGLSRARSFQTSMQRRMQQAVEEQKRDANIPEWKKYAPGAAPLHLLPANINPDGTKKEGPPPQRHAYRAGGFADIFKQIVVQTVLDLKVKKSDKPVWYVEPCAGEGEYHVSRMRAEYDDRLPMMFPKVEDLWSVLKDQDLTYTPPEIQGWMKAVSMLNNVEGWEVKGNSNPGFDKDQELQWLPSTAFVALGLLRKQDPVTLWEDGRIAFAALYNFVRNWSSRFDAHIELLYKDGLKYAKRRWMERRPGAVSEAHGPPKGQRGLVFLDPDYTRGGEAERCKELLLGFWKHWRAATVVMVYPIGPGYEIKARKFNKQIREADRTMDLITVEAYCENPARSSSEADDSDDDDEADDSSSETGHKKAKPIRGDKADDSSSETGHKKAKPIRGDKAKWRGCGVLISMPPFTAEQRIEAAMNVIFEELSKMPQATPMHVIVERL
eukprot:TRINITY_DN2659_c0_g1_i1.p1 TRINITY_DN2659_c0_g1~~TRINITY_DN2659_c0_g1_i1.p1  ORF type:complete len:655 (-),score=110.13 TRINITY_DN2659_c0_g1_i1:18-1934(-)